MVCHRKAVFISFGSRRLSFSAKKIILLRTLGRQRHKDESLLVIAATD
jgi:hypothetical protein